MALTHGSRARARLASARGVLGAPEVYVSKLSHMRFEPSGMTTDADIRIAKSIVDYIFRCFGKRFLTVDVIVISVSTKARSPLSGRLCEHGGRVVLRHRLEKGDLNG